MFDRYTEKARRVIFFARYEASQFGQPYIESEHLLFGLLREDHAFVSRHLTATQVQAMRREVDLGTVIREKVSTSVDLPLSNESKRILAYAAEEAELAGHKHIGTEHLAAGILREETCRAADLLRAHGVTLEAVRDDIRRPAPTATAPEAGTRRFVAPTFVSFLHAGNKVMSGTVGGPIPRVGDHISVPDDSGMKTYRVAAVTYHYEKGPSVGPVAPTTITVDLEEE